MEDQFIIQQVLRGNREAYRFLVLRYQRPLFRFLTSYRLEQSVRDELAQETFLAAFDHLGEYASEKGASFSSWLFVIAKNKALNELARHSRKRESSEDADQTYATVADEAASTEEMIDAGLSARRVTEAIRELPLAFRSALTLSYIQELPIEEVASIEGCSVGTVKSRVFRGKALLRLALRNPRGI